MTDFDESFEFQAEQFGGTARLFPLPNLVMFPHVMQPLHVFESRYRALVEDALSGDRLIAMTLLKPGWEDDYDGAPPIYTTGCLGRIATYHRFDDGRYNLLLMGLSRIQIGGELKTPEMFRWAQVDLLDDEAAPSDASGRTEMRRRLVNQFRRILPSMPDARGQLEQLLEEDLSLGQLTDIVAFSLELDLGVKMQLLGEVDTTERARILVEHLSEDSLAGENDELAREFPPGFSLN